MFYVFTEVLLKIMQLLLNKTSSHFQLLPMSKVDQSYYTFMRCRLYNNEQVQ